MLISYQIIFSDIFKFKSSCDLTFRLHVHEFNSTLSLFINAIWFLFVMKYLCQTWPNIWTVAFIYFFTYGVFTIPSYSFQWWLQHIRGKQLIPRYLFVIRNNYSPLKSTQIKYWFFILFGLLKCIFLCRVVYHKHSSHVLTWIIINLVLILKRLFTTLWIFKILMLFLWLMVFDTSSPDFCSIYLNNLYQNLALHDHKNRILKIKMISTVKKYGRSFQ